MSAQVHRAEAAQVRKLLGTVRRALKAAKSGALKALEKEAAKLRKRQATLAGRASRIAREYGNNRERLRKLTGELEPLLREARALEREVEQLKERRARAVQLYFEQLNPRRQAAARKAGRRSWEKRSEWLDAFLRTIPDDAPQALAVAVARRSGWLTLDPERAAERFAEWLEGDGEQEKLAHQVAAAERAVKKAIGARYREELEAQLAGDPDFVPF